MDPVSIVLSILAVGFLIIFHEAGHYFAAKWSGMSVSKFSIGFGPAIAKFDRGETTFQIGVLPLGGFVQIDGMSPEDGTDPEAPSSYLNRPFHQRFATILAGPAANYLLAFVVLGVFFAAFRYEALPPVEVVSVLEDSPAAKGGLQAGDVVTGVGGEPFATYRAFWEAIAASEGKPIPFDVRRGGEATVVEVTPDPTEKGGFRIGVEPSPSEIRDVESSVGEALSLSAQELWLQTKGFVVGLSAIFSGDVQVSGPIGIVKGLARTLDRVGAGALQLVGRISIILGIANLLPIPGLDGARLLFLLVGAVRRKPLNPKVETIVHASGVLLLLLMLVWVSVLDVTR